MAGGFEWKNRDTNFDNVYNGMLTLFIISTLEGWPNIMFNILDANFEEYVAEFILQLFNIYYKNNILKKRGRL